MIDISVRGLVKAFEEDKNILDGLSFEVNTGERVAILGKNGAGKTTLFRLITEELTSDEGDIVIGSGLTVGLISQIPVYPQGFTVEDVLKEAQRRVFELGEKLREMQRAMESRSDRELLLEYDRKNAEFEALGGWDTEFMRSKVANGLDIPGKMRAQLFEELSGVEKTRVNLARLILENTDILLLDEPTNHLDLRATEWLEDYLVKFTGTVLMISHDRYFLDRVATRTIEIVNGKAEFYSGNYSFYIAEKQRRYEEQLQKFEREQSEAKRLQKSADRLAQWGIGNSKLMKRSQDIEKRIERITKTDRPVTDRKMRGKFSEMEFRGDDALIIDGLSKSYGDRTLFSGVSLEVVGGERIALIGDNGTGKTTLLRIIQGEIPPDKGFVRFGPAVKTAFLEQIVEFQRPHLSVLDTMIYETNCSTQTVRNRLGAYKFSGEDVFRPVSALSGGERSRLRLCILMGEEINFLMLDEPTNHLDIPSREWIEEAISEFSGNLLFVSHDRFFIERFATRIWALSDGRIIDFRGSFEKYRVWIQTEAARQEKNISKDTKNDAIRGDTRKKNQRNTEKLLQKVVREIEQTEEKIREIQKLEEAASTDYLRLMELANEREALDKDLQDLYFQWEDLSG